MPQVEAHILGNSPGSHDSCIRVQVWHATSWEPGAELRKVHTACAAVRVDGEGVEGLPAAFAQEATDAILEAAFEAYNIGEDDAAMAYRARSLRSLSVGDHVVIGEMAYRCDTFGWSRVHMPVA